MKHLGIARRSDNGVELRVHPTLVPEKHLLASIEGVMNAILIDFVDQQGNTKRIGGKNGQFMGRINAFNIECRIRFSIPEILRLLQRLTKQSALIIHFCQNEIGHSG
jgi:hypothetical protein